MILSYYQFLLSHFLLNLSLGFFIPTMALTLLFSKSPVTQTPATPCLNLTFYILQISFAQIFSPHYILMVTQGKRSLTPLFLHLLHLVSQQTLSALLSKYIKNLNTAHHLDQSSPKSTSLLVYFNDLLTSVSPSVLFRRIYSKPSQIILFLYSNPAKMT